MNVERKNREPIILNDPGRWEDPIFQQITIQSFVSLGLSKKGEGILKRVFASNAIACLDDLLKIVEDMDEDKELKKEALSIVKVAKSSSDYNDTCYVTGTKEKSRVARWPNNNDVRQQSPDLFFDINETHFYRHTKRFIARDTPVGSAGSCFAAKIAHMLQHWGYNYVLEEDDLPADFDLKCLTDSVFRSGSARYGNIFTPASLRQLIERAYGAWRPDMLLVDSLRKGWSDPFRRVYPEYSDLDGFKKDHVKHTKALRRAFDRCKVFVITLGSTEAWQFAHSGDYLVLGPDPEIDGHLLHRKTLTLEECNEDLSRFVELYRKHVPNIKIIVTVSPVPLNKTHDPDLHVVSATMKAKSTLVVAAHSLVEKYPDCVYYLPSFETVMYGVRNPWQSDMRHVSNQAVRRVMKLFQIMFMEDQSEMPLPKFEEEPPASFRDRFRRWI